MNNEYLPGDRELFAMMNEHNEPKVAPVKRRKPPVRRKKRGPRIAADMAMTLICLAAAILGYMELWLGAMMAVACFARLARRIWRWRHG